MNQIPRDAPLYSGQGRVLRIKEGYNPNSSSLGSIVFSFPAALLAAPVLLAGAAAWIAARVAAGPSAEKDTTAPRPGEKA